MNNWQTFSKFTWWTAIFMTLVLFWDHYILKVNTSASSYIIMKTLTVGSYYVMGIYVAYSKKVGWLQDAYGFMAYVYAFYGMAFLDMTYSFSFIEAFIVVALGMRISAPRFIAINFFGLIALMAGHYYAREPLFVAAGESFKSHSLVMTIVIFMLAMMIHFIITRQQNQIQELNEKFALVGKQSSFLMHEIKNPLNRVVANAEEKGMTEAIMQDIRRDSQKISALVNSVEILIHDPKSLSRTFTHFEWSEVSENLHLDFNSYLLSMNIKFDFSELKGTFYGNKSLMYQLLRNNIINAIEAIGFRKDEISEINVKLKSVNKDIVLTIFNTNSFISSKDLGRIFEPHFSTKKTGNNKGLGLALTKSIIEAHNGRISVTSESNKTSFEITLPNYSMGS